MLLINIQGLLLAVTEKEGPTALDLIGGSLGLLIVLAIVLSKVIPRRKAKKQLLEETNEFKAQTDTMAAAKIEYLSGLPAAGDALCWVGIAPGHFAFRVGSMVVKLPMEKVMDMGLRTKVEVKNHYVSDAGGAVAGGMMFGELGAMVGGGVEKITEREINQFLVITYRDQGRIGHIYFDSGSYPKECNLLLDYYHSQPRMYQNVQM